MTKTVTAIFNNRLSANHAINLLKKNGVHDKDLSILAAESSVTKNIVLEGNSKAPEGATIGAGIGAAAGAALAGLTAIGTVTLTGGAGLLAAGPVVSAFAGAGAGSTVGSLIGGLVGLGVPETEAKLIDEKLGTGHVMVGVTVSPSREKDLHRIFEKANPENVTTH